MCRVCVRSQPTSCCSHVATRVCAPSLLTVTGLLDARKPTAVQNVRRVAHDAHTDTLLLLVQPPTYNIKYLQLATQRLQWFEVQRLDTRIQVSVLFYMAVCESRVLLGNETTLYVFDVSAAHTLSDAGSIVDQRGINGLACIRRDGDTLVSTANWTSVSLQRLASLPLRLEHIATSGDFTRANQLLFRGELLLVADRMSGIGKHAIVSFRTRDKALNERRELLSAQKSEHGCLDSRWQPTCSR